MYNRNKGLKCSTDGCERPAACKGMCLAHYRRGKYGSFIAAFPIGYKVTGAAHPSFKRGEIANRDGRVMVYCPSHPSATKKYPYVYRYRLVMESAIGRILSTDEIVHHKNGDKSDDRIENLELHTRSSHMRLHCAEKSQLRWAGNWDCCINCKTTTKKHKGRGLCATCHRKERYANNI